MGGACSAHGRDKECLKILVGKPEEKRLLRRSRHRWEDNIKVVLRETVEECGLESSGSGQGPVAGSCEHSNEPLGSIKCGECLE
jgi:hypothetical protein